MSMRDKVVVVTGATSGIGRETALALAGEGAHLALVAREEERGRRTAAEIAERTGSEKVDVLVADLAEQDEVRMLAGEVRSRYERLDVLVNNAGADFLERAVTGDGLECTFALNHLAPFLLTNLLTDLLVASAPARVVTVASGAHGMGRIRFEDLQAEVGYRHARAYAQSKLANVMFTYELARRLEGTGVTANCLHPGFVDTKFHADLKGPARLVMHGIIRPTVMRTPERGAETVVYLASAPEVEAVSGRYFVDRRPRRSSRRSRDEDAQRRLWEVSAELTRLTAERRTALVREEGA